MHTTTNAYNEVINKLKHDLKMQQEVNKLIENMHRPYKEGVPGIHRNISEGLQDYRAPNNEFHYLDDHESKFLQKMDKNEERWINQSVFYPKYYEMSHIKAWQNELDKRPVTKHFHHDKGFKYDVEVPYAERYPHVADRLGHPELLGTTFERLLRLEGDLYHPVYINQPFVQTPPHSPSKDLNFEEGEVIYENTKILEWAKFINLTGLGVYAFLGFFVPYSLLYKTHIPMPHAYDNMFMQYHQVSPFFFDNNGLQIPVILGLVGYSAHYALSAMNRFFGDYVVRMQFNKDKELLFVTRISPFCSTEEQVYEMSHIEALPPSVKAAIPYLSAQDDDGLIELTCMNQLKHIVLSKEDKYWNPELKDDFLRRTNNLWTKDFVEPTTRQEQDELAKLEEKIIIS